MRTSGKMALEMKVLASEERRKVLMRFFKTGKGQYGEADKFLGVMVPRHLPGTI